MKPGGIGWLGDQTLYSWMSVNGTPAHEHGMFTLLPCGWNRQIGTHMAGWRGFWRRHKCERRCHVLHGNGIAAKFLLGSLQADPSGRACAASVAEHAAAGTHFPNGTADGRMLRIVGQTCCPRTRPAPGLGRVAVARSEV